ncbi:hypothetical protein ACIBG8_08050 [Nonomuraea sp. NPDC050556]|uniref:hypothetical protein n=1 Tax=Nonomuraea sp. NPDC050556 TaxID=3364369 RepID=UPI003792A8CC
MLIRMAMATVLTLLPPPPAPADWEVIRLHDYGGCDSMLTLVPLSRSDVWAFGQTDPIDDECAGGGVHPVAQHWDGRAWKTARLPGPIYGTATSGGASAPGDVWAFTSSDTGEAHALRFDGSRWRDTTAPGMRGFDQGLVLGRHHVWTFGSGTWFWNGHRWRRATAPFVPTQLSAASQTDVWAVDAERVMRFNGTTWRRVRPGSAVPKATSLTGVLAISAKDVWIFGEPAVAAHFDGSAWTSVPVPLPYRGWTLGQAVADGAGGIRLLAHPENGTSVVLSRSASGQWTTSAPRVAGNKVDLWGLARIPGTKEIWAVGSVWRTEDDHTSAVFRLKG